MRSTNRFLLSCLIACLCVLAVSQATAHGIDHEWVSPGTRTLEIQTPDGQPFASEAYEILGPGDTATFQTGRTDRLGRVHFAPDRIGTWTVKVWSEDGHGLTTTLEIESLEIDTPIEARTRDRDRTAGIVTGLLLVIGIGAGAYIRARRQES